MAKCDPFCPTHHVAFFGQAVCDPKTHLGRNLSNLGKSDDQSYYFGGCRQDWLFAFQHHPGPGKADICTNHARQSRGFELTYLTEAPAAEVTVFYDGSCPLCAAEMGYYKRADLTGALKLVDVSSDAFSGDARITQQAAMARFHVRLADGQQVSGARGFIEVWRVIPMWSWLAKCAKVPGVVLVLEVAYRIFLRVRPLTVFIFKRIRRRMGQNEVANSNSKTPPK